MPDYESVVSGWSDLSPPRRSPGPSDAEEAASDGEEADTSVVAPPPDYARPIEFDIMHDDPAHNLFAVEFVSDQQIGDVTRRSSVRSWKLFLKHFCTGTPISYDTVERRVFQMLPTIRVSWKVQNLETKKFFHGVGVSFPEKIYQDRTLYETLMTWCRVDLRDIIRWHAGVHSGNCSFVDADGIIQYSQVHLTVTFDGIPLSNTSPDNLNVMALRFRGCRLVHIPAARIAKRREPKCVEDFVGAFVQQANELSVTVDYFVADAPMRAFLKCLKGHAGRHSCESCEARGVCISRRIVYPACMVHQRARTMERWLDAVADLEEQRRSCPQENNVKGIMGRSPLLALKDFDIVRKAPTDPMHRDWLGLARNTLWRPTVGIGKSGAMSSRGSRITSHVSQHYRRVRLPGEFTHASRPIEFPHFKAQEWKTMILTSFMSLCEIVNTEIGLELAHIWTLFTFLMFLYYGPDEIFQQFDTKDLDDMHQLFYDEFQEEFGQAACSYNLHAFYHLPEVRKMGRFTLVSTETFESAYGQVQMSYRPGTRNVGLQIVRNMLLKSVNHTHEFCEPKLKLEPETTNRFDNSIVLDEHLNFYKIKLVKKRSVTVVRMLTSTWTCPWDGTLPFDMVGVKQFTKYGEELIELPKQQLKGKGIHLHNGLLIPMYWDFLFS